MVSKGVAGVGIGLAVLMGAVIPIFSLYFMTQGLNVFAGVIVIFLAIIGGGVLGVVSMGISLAGPFAENKSAYEAEEKVRVLRASHRALLEEMDEQIGVLKEIRDSLKGGGGSSP